MTSIHEEPGFVGKLLSTEELEPRISKLVNDYNHERYHESLDNLTPPMCTMGEGKPYLSAESVLNSKPWKCEGKSITLTGLIS